MSVGWADVRAPPRRAPRPERRRLTAGTPVGSAVTVLLAVLASLLFALGTVLQQRGTMRSPAASKGLGFIVQLFRHPVWLIGTLLLGVGFALQVAALAVGSLVVVQAVVISSWVLALPIGVWLSDQRIGRFDVIGASTTVVGLLLFLIGGHPTGGTDTVATEAWAVTLAVTAVLLVVLDVAARRTRPAVVAALLGTAGGLSVGVQSGLVKGVSHVGGGVGGVLGSWLLYTLVVVIATTFVYQQRSLRVGVLAPALATGNAANLVSSVVLGTCLFAERLGHGLVDTALAAVGLALVMAGILVLVVRGQPPAVMAAGTASVEGAVEVGLAELVGPAPGATGPEGGSPDVAGEDYPPQR